MLSFLTPVQIAIDNIDNGSVPPVVDPNDGYVYYLDTNLKYLGVLVYTRFNRLDLSPIDTTHVRYSAKHRLVEAFYNPLSKKSFESIYDTFPGDFVPPSYDPSVIPGKYLDLY